METAVSRSDARTQLPIAMVSFDRRGEPYRSFDGAYGLYESGGKAFMDGSHPYWSWGHVHAFDIQTGKVVWEQPQAGQGETWTGTLSTASGLVFYGDDGGALAAADAATGRKLWSFPFTDSLHTSPMTYMFDNKQYVGMLVGSIVYAFGLNE